MAIRISKRGRINEGRPTKYRPEFCQRVIELGREGVSVHSMALKMGLYVQDFYTWQKQHPEFLDAITRARQLAQGWWEEQGRLGINRRDFNANAYSLQVRNRFPQDWKDKQEVELAGNVEVRRLSESELRVIAIEQGLLPSGT